MAQAYLNEKIKIRKNIVTAWKGSSEVLNFTSNDQEIKINLTHHTNLGDKLTLNNGEIIVGEGIKKVMISAQIQLTHPTTQYSTTNIGVVIGSGVWARKITPDDDWIILTVPNHVVEVNQGDILRMRLYSGRSGIEANVRGSSSRLYTFLTVEVLE